MSNTISSFFSFSPNTKARATEVNANFSNFRGSLIPINTDTITASDGVHGLGNSSYSWKDVYISSSLKVLGRNHSLLPKGAVVSYPYSSAPSGTLICDGSSISRSTYSDLFSAVTNGTNTSPAFGYETTTHFNIPDLRGKFVRGVDSGAGNDPDASSRTAQGTNGSTGDSIGSIQGFATGAPITTITTDSVGAHTHEIMNNQSGTSYGFFNEDASQSGTFSTDQAGNHVHTWTSSYTETRPKNLYLNYYIVY